MTYTRYFKSPVKLSEAVANFKVQNPSAKITSLEIKENSLSSKLKLNFEWEN